MTLVQLRHVLALAQSGSFNKAAAAMFLTQPALSRSIQALEAELGQPLFDRVGRRSELTPFGRGVLDQARAIVLAADDLQDSGPRLAGAVPGSLRIGLGSGPGALLMKPLLLHMATHHPQLKLDIAGGSTERLERSLRERSLDALVVDARSLKPAPDLLATETYELRGAFMCGPGHPLAAKRGSVSFDQLRGFPIASTPLSDQVARLLVERYGPSAHPSQLLTLRCEHLPSLVDLARHSQAVLLAIRAAGTDLVELNVQPALKATARFALVTLAGRSEVAALPTLRGLMKELLRDAGAAKPAARSEYEFNPTQAAP